MIAWLPKKIRDYYTQGFKSWQSIGEDTIHIIHRDNSVDVWKLSENYQWYKV